MQLGQRADSGVQNDAGGSWGDIWKMIYRTWNNCSWKLIENLLFLIRAVTPRIFFFKFRLYVISHKSVELQKTF